MHLIFLLLYHTILDISSEKKLLFSTILFAYRSNFDLFFCQWQQLIIGVTSNLATFRFLLITFANWVQSRVKSYVTSDLAAQAPALIMGSSKIKNHLFSNFKGFIEMNQIYFTLFSKYQCPPFQAFLCKHLTEI